MKYIFIVALLFATQKISGQSTWFKFIPGWEARSSFLINDTIVSMGTGDYSFYDFFAVFNRSNVNGSLLKSDTLDYKSMINDFNVTSSFWNSKLEPLNLNNKIIIPINVIEKTASKYDNRSYLFEYPQLNKIPTNLNHDTFTNYIILCKTINNKRYFILEDIIQYNKTSRIPSFYLYQLLADTAILIRKQFNDASSIYGHIPYYENLHKDNQNPNILFLEILDRWDFSGDPASFQMDVVKMDTLGNQIWKCRPSDRQDSINTTAFQMVQKPNGNILCTWLDFYYRPWKHPSIPSIKEQINKNATIWFAEIDYQTGAVLWRKNIKQYLGWKVKQTDIPNRVDETDILFNDAKLIDNNSVLWIGHRTRTYNLTQSWKRLPVLLKTDLEGNPLWYREYDFYSTDTGDKGMQVYSFIQTPDKGFLLTGEYQNRMGQLSNGEFWQKAALLKLDSNGCYIPGCNATDNIVKIKVPDNVCLVYPNPAARFVTIEYPKGSNIWEISISDINGKEVFKTHEKVNIISTANLPNGNYLIQLTNKSQYHHETHKIIIQH
jgi:hypothetical protein